MPRPEPELLRMADDLGLPQPERARFFEEVTSDLEELQRELVGRGLEPLAAHAEALRLLAPSRTALAAVASVHEPFYASLARRFSSEMRLAEWAGLVGVTLAALLWAVGSVAAVGIMGSPPLFLLPVLAATVAVIVLAGRKWVQLYVLRDHSPERLRVGLGGLLVASAGAVVLAFFGAVIGTIVVAGHLEAAPDRSIELIVPWLLDTAVLISAGLVTALVGGLAWFLLSQKAAAVANADLRASRALERALSPAVVHLELPTLPPTRA